MKKVHGLVIMLASLGLLIYSLINGYDYSVNYSGTRIDTYSLSNLGIIAVVISSVFIVFGFFIFVCAENKKKDK